MEFLEVEPTGTVKDLTYTDFVARYVTYQNLITAYEIHAARVWDIMHPILWPRTDDVIHRYKVQEVDSDEVTVGYWTCGDLDTYTFPTRLLFLSDEALVEYCNQVYAAHQRKLKEDKARKDAEVKRALEREKEAKRERLRQLLEQQARGEF